MARMTKMRLSEIGVGDFSCEEEWQAWLKSMVEYYMNLPYTFELRRVTGEGWFIQVKELRGCMSQGDTAQKALFGIQEAMRLWLEVSLESGLSIPKLTEAEGDDDD